MLLTGLLIAIHDTMVEKIAVVVVRLFFTE